jgi:O-antigen/teichoic acid export membrane protein
MGDDLKKKMVSALTWTMVDRFGQQAIQLIIGLIFARLLSPSEFGLLGLVMVYMALSYVLIESGFTQALIRKKDANETDYNTVFYFNVIISLFLYLILFFTVPYIAFYFKQPQLVQIGRTVFIAIIFNAFCLVPTTKLTKALDFKTIAQVNIISIFLSGTSGLILAFMHFGVWSLVAQQVLFNFFRMVNFQIFVKWKPQRIFKFEVIKNFWSFSVNLLGTSILNVIFNNLYVLLLGLYYPIKQVGYYTQGNKLSETFNYTFQSILTSSTYPLFAKIQDDDERFRRVFREISKKVSIITFPIMIVLIVAAKPFILVLLTAKFLPSVPYFQLLLLAALFSPLYALNVSALNSRGKSKVTFRIEIMKKASILLSVIVCFKFGFIIMLWGYVIASLLAFIISTVYLKNDLTHFLKHQILDFVYCIFVGLFIAVFSYGLSFLIYNFHILLATQIIVSAILYFLIIFLFYKDLYNEIVQFVGKKLIELKFFRNKK